MSRWEPGTPSQAMKDRIAIEDALKHCHECEYQGRAATAASVAGVLGIPLGDASDLLARLVQQSLAAALGRGAYGLTDDGRRYALRVVRAHRLLETALSRDTGLPDTDLHARAEKEEHLLSDDEIERLATRLSHPLWDPHGDPIPTRAGELPEIQGRELGGCPEGWTGRIVHVEDEPQSVYERLAACGLFAGMRLRVVDVRPGKCSVNVEGRTVTLDTAMSALVRVVELRPSESFDEYVSRLSDLTPGERARIVGLGPGCRGSERHRLLDLGVVPGSSVSVDLVSPSGNPVAYRIRGACIALRREQAEHVYVHRIAEGAA